MTKTDLEEQARLAMRSCIHGYTNEIIESIKFENPSLAEEDLTSVVYAVTRLVVDASSSLKLET